MIELRIAERYAVGAELGRGTLASVYEATDTERGQRVALKLFARHLCAEPGVRAALLEHARRLAALDHPHVARVLDSGERDGQVYVVAELVPGGSLRALLGSAERLAPGRAVELALQVARALEAAHGLGLAHGDLRPENVLLDAAGRARPTDFGWADVLAAAGTLDPATIVSRAPYVALRRRGGDGPVGDVYQLAALLYELLTGRLPPAPAVPRPPVAYSPRLLSPAVPAWLERVVAYALGDEPSRRYRHVAALRHALEAPTFAPLPAAMPLSTARARRWPTLQQLLGALAGLWLRLLAVALPSALGGIIVAVVLTVALAGRVALENPLSELAPVPAPSLVGLGYDEAAERAMASGLAVARSSERPTLDRPRGHVLSQWPVPGTELRPGSVVRLSVSAGLIVPGVVGQSLDAARQELEPQGWSVGPVEQLPTLWAPPGQVLQQSPAAGDTAPDRGPLRLTVAALPPNLAAGAPVRASGGANAQAIVDGNAETTWSLGGPAPGQVEIDLGGSRTVQRVELVVAMKPDGWAAHELWVVDAKGKEQKVHVFAGSLRDGEVLTRTFAPGLNGVARVRVVTVGSVSYPGWREIRVY